jgi:hypothetical protein
MHRCRLARWSFHHEPSLVSTSEVLLLLPPFTQWTACLKQVTNSEKSCLPAGLLAADPTVPLLLSVYLNTHVHAALTSILILTLLSCSVCCSRSV